MKPRYRRKPEDKGKKRIPGNVTKIKLLNAKLKMNMPNITVTQFSPRKNSETFGCQPE
jgi:hypothetical protein